MYKLSESGKKTQFQINDLGKTIGAKITTGKYLDKTTLKKLISKKGDVMFAHQKAQPAKKTVTYVVEDAETDKVTMMEQMRSSLRDNRSDLSNSQLESYAVKEPVFREGTYSHMMHMLSKKIAVLPFVKKDENLEKRKERFFNGAKADAEGEIYHDVMKKIGYF